MGEVIKSEDAVDRRLIPFLIRLALVLIIIAGPSASNAVAASSINQQTPYENQYSQIVQDSDGFIDWSDRSEKNFFPDVVLVKFRSEVVNSHEFEGKLSTNSTSLSGPFRENGVIRVEPVFPIENSSTTLQNEGFNQQSSIHQIFRFHLKENSDVIQAAEQLSSSSDIEWAEPDYIAHAAFVPNDPKYSDQWGLAKIQTDLAWNVTQGSPAVAIAIIDTGLDLNHPDLAGKLWINPGEIAGNGQDDDSNGKIDDVNGWDWVENDNNPLDDIGHGTHVAGVAAASTNNGVGIAGACPNCRVMALKVLDAGGSGTYSNIAAGIVYAVDKGARVINLSLGGYAESSLLRDAVAYASQYAVVVAAAGNDNKQDRFYPAAYDDYVIAVAATDTNDQKTAFSNYGEWVDITAPGVSIWSTLYDDTYGAWSGSSMAVPFVSGVAGLVRSNNLSWSAGATRGQLLYTTDEIDTLNPGYEGKLGAGRLNANLAVTTSSQPELSIVSYAVGGVENGSPEPGSLVTMTVALRNVWGDVRNVTGILSTIDSNVSMIDNTADYGDIFGYRTVTNLDDSFSFSVDSATPHDHSILFSLALSGNGAEYSATLYFTVSVSSEIVYVSGFIEQDTLWGSNRTYIITSDVMVQPGITLTIEAGTIIEFHDGTSLVIKGKLIGHGTSDQQIIFTSTNPNPAPGDWKQILLDGGHADLAWCQIMYGWMGILAEDYVNPSEILLHDCIITDIDEWGIGVANYIRNTEKFVSISNIRT